MDKQVVRIILLLFLFLGFLMSEAKAQKKNKYDLAEMVQGHQLQIFNRTPMPFSDKGKKGVRFEENENDGVVWISGLSFSNGVIEVDIKGRDMLQKSFLGIAFHAIDSQRMDIVYFRPFNFRSSDSIRRIHAVQYVSSPDFGWKKLRDEQNGRYEKAVDPAPPGDDWFHARIVVKYPHVDVYVNEIRQPSLSVDKLNTNKSGKVGLWIGPASDGEFANLIIVQE